MGHVEYKKSYGIHIQIDSFEGGQKHRHISDLNIQVLTLFFCALYQISIPQGFISLKNLAVTVEDQDCLMKDLQPGDVLRGKSHLFVLIQSTTCVEKLS